MPSPPPKPSAELYLTGSLAVQQECLGKYTLVSGRKVCGYYPVWKHNGKDRAPLSKKFGPSLPRAMKAGYTSPLSKRTSCESRSTEALSGPPVLDADGQTRCSLVEIGEERPVGDEVFASEVAGVEDVAVADGGDAVLLAHNLTW